MIFISRYIIIYTIISTNKYYFYEINFMNYKIKKKFF